MNSNDLDLFLGIFNIYSSSGEESEMRDFIIKWLKAHDIEFQVDAEGNVFNIDNVGAPLVSAHMDAVMKDRKMFASRPIEILDTPDGTIVRAKGGRIIGADDKVGIYMIFKLLEWRKNINFLFTVGEEVGARGAHVFAKNNAMENVPYGLVLDRGNSGDIICSQNRYGTKEFEDALAGIGERFKFKPAHGIFSDCNALNSRISCANISVGYYKAHTFNEFCVLEEMEHSLEYVKAIITELNGFRFIAPVSYVHDVYFDKTIMDVFSNKCPITGDTEDLVYIDKLYCSISKRAAFEIIKQFIPEAFRKKKA